METLEQLVLRQALIDNYSQYALGIDSGDWSAVRACFSDRVILDYGDVGAGDPAPRDSDDWVLHLQAVLSGFDCTHHMLSNHRVTVSDDSVNCCAYMMADHVILPDPAIAEAGAEDICTVVGEYSNDYEQQPDGRWTICRSRLRVKWSSGNTNLFVTAAQRMELGN